jgi:hypothetical protein
MRKYLLILMGVLFIAGSSCNDKTKTDEADINKQTPKTEADSLMTEVMDGHDVGMAKYGKLNAMQNKVQGMIDSIGKLPAKTRTALAPYKANLDQLLIDLKSAKAGMDKWMDEFNMDSAVNDAQQRVKYLMDERLKVNKVKESILGSLQRADSLIKEKF